MRFEIEDSTDGGTIVITQYNGGATLIELRNGYGDVVRGTLAELIDRTTRYKGGDDQEL